MSRRRRFLDRIRPAFGPGGRWRVLHPLFEVIDTFLYSTDRQTEGAPHVRDAIDLKRVMTVVLVALAPCALFGAWNAGHQANLALETLGRDTADGWRGAVLQGLGVGVDPTSTFACLTHGLLFLLPSYAVCMAIGLGWEALFAVTRGRPISEGFFVTGLLFPLTLPPGVPLWQVAIGTSFGVVIAKEIFGGTGRNFLNPALAARALVYFAYPADHSGDAVWVAVDGWTQATPLTATSAAAAGSGFDATGASWTDAFLGTIPGSLGETSTLACLAGAALLVASRIASWRVMAGMLAGALAAAAFFFATGSATNPMFAMPPHWHLVTGGFAFGLVFMATDPVTSAQTDPGRWIYGALCGLFCVLVRVLNPGFSESVMIVILLGNVFAPLIDWFVLAAWSRRQRRAHASTP